MRVGDLALFYHSNTSPIGVYGIARVASLPYEDVTARNPKDEHFDKRSADLYLASKKDKKDFVPVWVLVDFEFVKKFSEPVTLAEIKNDPKTNDMLVCQKGSRLSIQPVSEKHFKYIVEART
jgi:predicted RNA-binding protein with PUA-like domain